MDESFGQTLKRARQDAGLSLRQMAERLAISRSAVSRCETGELLSERTVKRYAAALELNVELRLVPRSNTSG